VLRKVTRDAPPTSRAAVPAVCEDASTAREAESIATNHAHHRLPPPQRLIPEASRPREASIFDHSLVPAPGVVHQNIQTTGLQAKSAECIGNSRS
jgi:hypothetical protein